MSDEDGEESGDLGRLIHSLLERNYLLANQGQFCLTDSEEEGDPPPFAPLSEEQEREDGAFDDQHEQRGGLGGQGAGYTFELPDSVRALAGLPPVAADVAGRERCPHQQAKPVMTTTTDMSRLDSQAGLSGTGDKRRTLPDFQIRAVRFADGNGSDRGGDDGSQQAQQEEDPWAVFEADHTQQLPLQAPYNPPKGVRIRLPKFAPRPSAALTTTARDTLLGAAPCEVDAIEDEGSDEDSQRRLQPAAAPAASHLRAPAIGRRRILQLRPSLIPSHRGQQEQTEEPGEEHTYQDQSAAGPGGEAAPPLLSSAIQATQGAGAGATPAALSHSHVPAAAGLRVSPPTLSHSRPQQLPPPPPRPTEAGQNPSECEAALARQGGEHGSASPPLFELDFETDPALRPMALRPSVRFA